MKQINLSLFCNTKTIENNLFSKKIPFYTFVHLKNGKKMISYKDLATQSIEDLARMIETHHQETHLLYQALASKIKKQTEGTAFLSDVNVPSMEYWLKVAKEHPQILSAHFDLKGLEAVTTFFKSVTQIAAEDDARDALLKAARDNASQDCAWYISHIRKRVKELEHNPVFKLILQKAPNPPRQYTVKKATPPAKE